MTSVARIGLAFVLRAPRPGPRALWTGVGAAAVPLWATWPLLAALTVAEMPLFQYLAIIFAAGALTLMALRPRAAPAPQGGGLRASAWATAGMVALGLLVSDILFILALRQIPVAEANLLLYLWPLMVVALAAGLGLIRLRPLHLAAMVLGVVGAALVLGARPQTLHVQGVALALAGGLAWAIYVVFRLWQGARAPDALARGLALSAALALGLHLGVEDWVTPSAWALAGTVLVGVVPLALGNLAWDLGARRGDAVMLATLAYATPLVSMLFLSAAGLVQPGPGLVVGGILIALGGWLSARAG